MIMGHTVADQLVGGLIAAGVNGISGVVGDTRAPIVVATAERI
jgi:hypothetical protein